MPLLMPLLKRGCCGLRGCRRCRWWRSSSMSMVGGGAAQGARPLLGRPIKLRAPASRPLALATRALRARRQCPARSTQHTAHSTNHPAIAIWIAHTQQPAARSPAAGRAATSNKQGARLPERRAPGRTDRRCPQGPSSGVSPAGPAAPARWPRTEHYIFAYIWATCGGWGGRGACFANASVRDRDT